MADSTLPIICRLWAGGLKIEVLWRVGMRLEGLVRSWFSGCGVPASQSGHGFAAQ